MEFTDLNILDFGNNTLMCGAIYKSVDKTYFLYYPAEGSDSLVVDQNTKTGEPLKMTVEDWEALIKQTDDVLVKSTLDKVLVKKSQRNIDQSIVWKVYQRDNYTCRYCGRTGIPLTVDHIDLWEKGGTTTERNLFTACKQCNRNRGNMPYEDWLNSDYYANSAAGLTQEVINANSAKIKELPELEKLRTTKQRAPR
jgi:hypothetical protein